MFLTWLFKSEMKPSRHGSWHTASRRRARTRPLHLDVLEARCLLSFLPPVEWQAAFHAVAVTTADLRGNGVLDLIETNDNGGQNGTVTVLLGIGNGTFHAPVSYRVGGNPTSIAVADLTGNGIADLVVTNNRSDTVSVLLGNGDGTFQPAFDVPTGGGPRSVVVADFNGDGIPDLAVTQSSGANAVNVLLGNGDGTFQAPVAYAVGPSPLSVAAADLTGSGQLDLVVANELDKTVSVLLGNGDGTFQDAVNYDTGAGDFTKAMVIGDFNGDGVPDIAVANAPDHIAANGFVAVLLGNGDGTFQTAVSHMIGDPGVTSNVPAALAAGDFNHTGHLDLITANITNTLTVFSGNGDGTFQDAHFIGLNLNPNSVAVGDFNGDGFLDLAVTRATSSDTISVFMNAGDGRGAPGRADHPELASVAAPRTSNNHLAELAAVHPLLVADSHPSLSAPTLATAADQPTLDPSPSATDQIFATLAGQTETPIASPLLLGARNTGTDAKESSVDSLDGPLVLGLPAEMAMGV
jgi:hypothetical protein